MVEFGGVDGVDSCVASSGAPVFSADFLPVNDQCVIFASAFGLTNPDPLFAAVPAIHEVHERCSSILTQVHTLNVVNLMQYSTTFLALVLLRNFICHCLHQRADGASTQTSGSC